MDTTIGLLIAVAFGALLFEYIDASLGMGYGTALTPLLLIMGFSPVIIVPAVLLGQLAGGIVGGYFHYRAKNIKISFSEGIDFKKEKEHRGFVAWSLDTKVIFISAACGIIGAIIGVTLAVNIPEVALRFYIGIMVLGMGVIILVRRNHNRSFSWLRMIELGIISAVNKGISGGGYGPLMTGGQILSGREVKNSIGSTTVAEVAVCVVGFLSYVFLLKGDIHWGLAAATAIGSVMAGPLAAHTVKKIEAGKLKLVVGYALVMLGALTLIKIGNFI